MSIKFATYRAGNEQFYGAATDEGMIALSPEFPHWPTLREVIENNGLAALAKAANGKTVTHKDFIYERPIPHPEKIICVGVNFPDRNAEYNDGSAQPQYMSLFPRFERGFTGHGQNLVRPPENETLDYEGEIAIVIGKKGRRISQDDAYDHIAAVTLCNEGTIRDWVRHAKFNVTQGKNWDNSGAMGPWLVPFDNHDILDKAHIQTFVNGELRQDDQVARMMFPIRRQIEYISTFTTLMPGDIIVTGTPTGAGARFDPPRYLKPGDEVVIKVDGIGELRNGIEDEA